MADHGKFLPWLNDFVQGKDAIAPVVHLGRN